MNRQERKELTQWNNFIKSMRAKGALVEETVITLTLKSGKQIITNDQPKQEAPRR